MQLSALFVLLCLYNSFRATQWETCHWSVLCVCVRVSRRSNGEATSPFPSAKRTAAQAPEQPGRQSLLQPSQREFKAFHGSLCLTLFPDDNTIKATCARPPSPHPHAALPFCCLHHVLWRFICCFHVRMSPFTVNNWCGLSKPSKMPASSASAPRALIKKNYAVTSDIISICTHSTQNHFELKINDSLAHVPCFALVFSEAFLTLCACVCLSACVCVRWFCVLSAEKSGLSGEQEETQKTGVNNSFPSSYLNTPPAQEGSWEDHGSVCFSCKFAAENTSYLRSLFLYYFWEERRRGIRMHVLIVRYVTSQSVKLSLVPLMPRAGCISALFIKGLTISPVFFYLFNILTPVKNLSCS